MLPTMFRTVVVGHFFLLHGGPGGQPVALLGEASRIEHAVLDVVEEESAEDGEESATSNAEIKEDAAEEGDQAVQRHGINDKEVEASSAVEEAEVEMQAKEAATGAEKASTEWLFGPNYAPGPFIPRLERGPDYRSFVVMPTRASGTSAASLAGAFVPMGSLFGLGSAGEQFPLISFAHGIGALGQATVYTAYSGFLNYLASHGYAVVAHTDCIACGAIFGAQSAIQMKLIQAMKRWKHAKLINFTRVGVAGHSMGGGATVASAMSSSAKSLNIKAALAMHPSPTGGPQSGLDLVYSLKIRTFVTTGTADTTCPSQLAKLYYSKAPWGSYYLNVNAATHNLPGGPLSPFNTKQFYWQVRFLDCNVKQIPEACDELKKNMCSMTEVWLSECWGNGWTR